MLHELTSSSQWFLDIFLNHLSVCVYKRRPCICLSTFHSNLHVNANQKPCLKILLSNVNFRMYFYRTHDSRLSVSTNRCTDRNFGQLGCHISIFCRQYTPDVRQISNNRRTLVGNIIADHSEIVGAAPGFTLDLTHDFNKLRRDNGKTRWKIFKFWGFGLTYIRDLTYLCQNQAH